MAQQLNDYFSSVFTTEDLTTVPAKPMETRSTLSTIVMKDSIIREKISQLKEGSAPGPDGICSRLLKELAHVIVDPLRIIFEKTLEERKCPDDWKKANVIPIYKKGPKGKSENYRPVSLTSIVCKIFNQL